MTVRELGNKAFLKAAGKRCPNRCPWRFGWRIREWKVSERTKPLKDKSHCDRSIQGENVLPSHRKQLAIPMGTG